MRDRLLARRGGPTFDTLVRIAHAQDMQLVVELVPNNAAGSAEAKSSTDGDGAESEAQVLRAAF